MILIEKILSAPVETRTTDVLQLEWFETNKKIMRRHTQGGREVGWRGLPVLNDGDVLWMDDALAIIVQIQPAAAIVLSPVTMQDMAAICYEIGNKHLPLFLDGEAVLVPFEEPLFRWLEAKGYQPRQEQRVLTNMLRSNVMPHAHGGGTSLFSKIMQLTSK